LPAWLDLRPRVALILIAASSAAIHALLGLLVRGPFFTPDEWLYALLARSFLTRHPGEIHGSHIPIGTTISYVGPILNAPMWLVHDVAIAYHSSQALASIAFAAATFPAYLLGRRVGLDTNGALVVALFSQLLPAGAFTATLLSEPFAYPLLLAAVLVGIDALASPRPARVTAVAAISAVLCVAGGFQFLVFPCAWVAAFVAGAPTSRRALGRAFVAAATVAALVTLAKLAGGGFVVDRVLLGARSQSYPIGSLAGWFGVDMVTLALASGWVIVPAATVGIAHLMAEREPHARAFGWLVAFLTAGFLAEAAIWGANGNGLYERFTFYASPLLAVAFVREVTRWRSTRRLPYAVVAYGAAAAALLLPLTADLVANEGHSPTMLGLVGDRAIRVIWPPLFAVLAVVAAAVGAARGRLLAAIAAAVLVCTAASGFHSLLRGETYPATHVVAPTGTALLADPVQSNYEVATLKMLFWNPELTRLVVFGSGTSPDPAGVVQGQLSPHGPETTAGRPIAGPLAVGDDVSAWHGDQALASGHARTLDRAPDLLFFGWGPGGRLAPVSELLASSGPGRHRRIAVRLTAGAGVPVTVNVRCDAGATRRRSVVVPRRRTIELVVDVPPGSSQLCRLALAPAAGSLDERSPALRATLASSAAAT
jgi:hypothetical protein